MLQCQKTGYTKIGLWQLSWGFLCLAGTGRRCCSNSLPTVTFLVHLHNLWFYWAPSAYGNAFLCVRQQATGFSVNRGYSNKITQQRKQQNAIQADTVVCLSLSLSIFPRETLTDVRAYYGHSGLSWEHLLEALEWQAEKLKGRDFPQRSLMVFNGISGPFQIPLSFRHQVTL